MSLNTTLGRANKARNDEFYTRLADVETELRYYRDQFRGKAVLCNCDDPYESAFFRYFAMNFGALGLRKLTAVSYAGSPVAGSQVPLPGTACKTGITEAPGGLPDVEKLLQNDANTITPLAGDGDFRSPECIALLDEADIVVTNPPFSLFREYIAQLIESGKQFLILGNMNAITYREIFALIMENQLWLGYHNGGCKWFRVPDDYTHTTTKSRIKIEDGIRYLSLGNTAWFTNLDTTKRHDFLDLYKSYTPREFPAYTNYPAIEVSRVADIPADYDGAMGVPITFLDKYNPDQFEILGSSNLLAKPMSDCAKRGTYSGNSGRFYVPASNGKHRRLYDRIAIRRTGGTS